MFELIRANKRRSMVLMFFMLVLLLALGFAIGGAVVSSLSARPESAEDLLNRGFVFDPAPGFVGMGVAFVLWMVQSLVAYFQGGRILLNVSGAKLIEREDHPQLHNVVEEMCIAASLSKVPKIYVIDDMAMNAFATGRGPENAAVAVTAGLLGRMNRDQLQGVIAHEIAHIMNRDVLFMTMAGIMVGTIVMIAEVFLRGLRMGASRSSRYGSSRSNKGGGQAIMLVVALLLAVLAPILAQMLYFACSRQREYLADAGSAVYTRYPEGLASALEAIGTDSRPLEVSARATAPMYIANPLDVQSRSAIGLLATHPPLDQRVRILRTMAGGASYRDYQAAWSKAGGRAQMPSSALAAGPVPLRAASSETAEPGPSRRQQMRQAGDLLRKVNQFIFLTCLCGLRIKVPPESAGTPLACPRCKRELEVPVAQSPATGSSAAGENIPYAVAKGEAAPLEVVHRGQWLTFRCPCGARRDLAPGFEASSLRCAQCGREIHVRHEPTA